MTKKSLLGFCMVLVMLLTACGAGAKEEAEDSPLPAGYVLQSTVDLEGGGENFFFSTKFLNGKLYSGIYSYEEGDGESAEAGTGASVERILSFSEEGEFLGEAELVLGNTRNSVKWCVDSEENFYIVAAESESFAANGGSMRLYKFDSEGNTLYQQDIPTLQGQAGNSLYIDALAADADGRVYALFGENIFLFRENGTYDGSVTMSQERPLSLLTGGEGEVYALCRTMDGGWVLNRIDPEKKTAETAYSGLPSADNRIVWCAENALLCHSQEGLYLYDGESGEQKLLLQWLNMGIQSSDVRNFGVTAEGELLLLVDITGGSGKISQLRIFAPITADQAAEQTATTQSTGTQSVRDSAFVTSPGVSADDEWKVVTLVTFTLPRHVENVILEFNSSNEEYRIEVVNLFPSGVHAGNSLEFQDQRAHLEMELALGTQDYDLIDLNNFHRRTLGEAGILEDLYLYLDASETLSREDFFQGALSTHVVDGKLVSIPKYFMVDMIVGKAADFGDRTGWTMREFLDYALAHPEARLFEDHYEDVLWYHMLRYCDDSFVSVENGEVFFDAELCRDFLQIMKKLLEEVDPNGEESIATRIRRGDVLLRVWSLYHVDDLVRVKASFGEPITFLGFPDAEGETSYFYRGLEPYAINSSSNVKEGAWEFIEFFLNSEVEYYFNFPVQKSEFERLAAEELSDQWLKDEEGNLILDENGEPQLKDPEVIYERGDGTVESIYPREPITEEDVETVRSILETGGLAMEVYSMNEDVFNIIVEEADAYFTGQRPLDIVVDQIGSRLTLYLQERQ